MLRDEIASVLYHECDEETWNYGSIADSILSLPTGMVKVSQCPKCKNGFAIEIGEYSSSIGTCSTCHGTGGIVRILTLGEAVELLKHIIEPPGNTWPIITLPDGSRVRAKK